MVPYVRRKDSRATLNAKGKIQNAKTDSSRFKAQSSKLPYGGARR
jgi:hypothetical protein